MLLSARHVSGTEPAAGVGFRLRRTFSSASIAPSAAMCSATFSPPLYSWMVGIFCGNTHALSSVLTCQAIKGVVQLSDPAKPVCRQCYRDVSRNNSLGLPMVVESGRDKQHTLMPAPYTSAEGTAFTSTKSTGSLHVQSSVSRRHQAPFMQCIGNLTEVASRR